MDTQGRSVIHSSNASSLVDVLERILDKGLVVAGDITLKIVDIELLTIQIRLLVCSVDKAREMGMNWWMTNAYAGTPPALPAQGAAALALPANAGAAAEVGELAARVSALEGALERALAAVPGAAGEAP
jgi:hypothetical protein